MNGIDISDYQNGINLAAVPCDFVIIKATGGTGYINPDCDRAFQQAVKNGKKAGVYHYARERGYEGSAVQEAEFFVDNCKGYIGKALLALDWEAQKSLGVSWAKAWLDKVYELTSVRPVIYMSKTTCREYDWSPVAAANYGLWCAQYANNDETGYQTDPWTDDEGIGAFPQMAIYQYTSNGRLPGWDGSLDLDLFYGSREAWDDYAKTTRRSEYVQHPGNTAYKEERIWYRAHVADAGWLDAVRDGQTAGLTGYNKELEAIKIDCKLPGVKIRAKAHIENKGWVDYGYITRDTVIGTTGEHLRIEAIDIEAENLPNGWELHVQGHLQDAGWTGWVKGGSTGTTGLRKQMEAIRMKID